MDHQQNYEFPDPNSFGFINSFSGSDNFLISQPQPDQQQHNGKDHSHPSSLQMSSMQTFEQPNPSNPYNSQPPSIMYDLPEVIVPQQPVDHFPSDDVGYLNVNPDQSNINITSQKESLFNMENPPPEVPANIIQQEPEDVEPTLDVEAIPPAEHQPDTTFTSQPPSETTVELPSALETPSAESPAKSSESVFSPEQNNMMKALGVVRKEVLGKSGSKKRRRILQLNEEDSEEESDLKKELLQDSPEKDKEKAKDESEDTSPDSESDDPSIANNPEALKARSLLKSAVIILGPKSKKKKRVLESDDEDEMRTSVDDIGLLGSNENDIDNSNDEQLFGEAFDSIEGIENNVLIENPIIPQDEFVVPVPPHPLKTEETDDKQLADVDASTPEITVKTEKSAVKTELEVTPSIIKTEDGEIDPAMSVEAILENIKPMADDDEFFKAAEKSDDSDCQFVSNEDYFGTPDLNKPPPSFTRIRMRSQKTRTKRKTNLETKRRKRSNKYEQDFVEGSSESDDTTYSESSPDSSDSSTERARRKAKVAPKKPTFLVQPAPYMRVPMKRPMVKKDRFYDRSRDIPNDVYFGDVKVPLHVLHTRWNDDKDDFPEPERSIFSLSAPNRFNYTSPSTNFGRPSFSNKPKQPTFSYVEQSEDPKLSTLKDFAKMAGIKLNFARLFDGVRSTEDKCVQIRRVLAQKGLQGEPTVAKCKQLRLDLQAKRESAELDKSLIIRTEGRTRRATRRDAAKSPFSSQPSTSSAVVQPETLQTLSKIRRVVDSDSE